MKRPASCGCVGLLLLVVVVIAQASADNGEKTVCRLDDDSRYLEIVQIPKTGNARSRVEQRETRHGKRFVMSVHGECYWVLQLLHTAVADYRHRHVDLGPARIDIETDNRNYYEVHCYSEDKAKFNEVVERLGLETTVEKRPISAVVLESTGGPTPGLRPYGGKSRWRHPGAGTVDALFEILVMPKGPWEGKVFFRDSIYHFDGFTLDEFARFLEERFHIVVVNKTGETGRYSFALVGDLLRKIGDKELPAVLAPIGIKCSQSNREVLDVVVVRDKGAKKLTDESLSQNHTVNKPATTPPVCELVGKWRIKKKIVYGEQCLEDVGYVVEHDGRAFLPDERSSDGVTDVWQTTRCGDYYRLVIFDNEMGAHHWTVANRGIMKLEGNRLVYWLVDWSQPSPKALGPETPTEGVYIVFERVNDNRPKLKRWSPQKHPCRRWHFRRRRIKLQQRTK